MSIRIPNQNVTMVGKSMLATGDWYRWLRSLWGALGYDPKRAVYRRKFLHSISDMANIDSLSYLAYEGNQSAVQFSASSTERLYFGFELPDNYKQGTGLVPYIRWAPSDGSAGNVVWQISYSTQDKDGAPASEATSSIASAAPGTTEQEVSGTFAELSFIGRTRARLVNGAISRIGGDSGDTYAQVALLFGVGFVFQVNGAGLDTVTL